MDDAVQVAFRIPRGLHDRALAEQSRRQALRVGRVTLTEVMLDALAAGLAKMPREGK